MREVSPAIGITADEFLATIAPEHRLIVERIRAEKMCGLRPCPSSSLIDKSSVLTPEIRRRILDKAACLVDENLFGRSEMCLQFAILVQRALAMLQIDSRVAVGTAIYSGDRRQELFRWEHAWVRIGTEVVDGNTDILFENPVVPGSVTIPPFWGDLAQIPADRRLREERGARVAEDEDVENLWWPDLETQIKSNIHCI